jgi:hypothetical protein
MISREAHNMFVNNNEENIFYLVRFLPFAEMLGGDGPWGKKIDVQHFLFHNR